MNYNDFFRSALSAAYKKAPMTDDDTFMSIIKERAKNMKKDDNVRQMQFTEITPEYIEAKKSHKAISVVAGIAGTAAVLTGAVFGLNWLSEHGGLKEGGIESSNGAGYHEDITTPLSADTSETEDNANILATFVYDDFTVNITGYDFDGISLKVYYDTIFPDDCTLSSGERLASVLPMAIFTEENTAEGYGELISESENTQSCIFRETLEENMESLKVDFKPNKQGYAGSGGYPYTVYADHKKPEPIEIDAVGKAVNGVVPMDETVELDGMTVHFTGYEFDSQYMRIEYNVKYTDGEQHHTTGAPVRPIEIAGTLVGDGMVVVVSHPAYRYENDLDDTIYCYADVVINGTPDYVRIPFGYAVFPEDLPAEPYTEEDELFAITVHFDPDSAIRTFWNDRVNIGETGKQFKIADAFITPTHISARLKFDEKPTQELTDNITAGLRLKDGSSIELTNKKTIGYTKDGDLYWLVAWYDEPIALDDIADANICGFYFSEPDEEYFEMMKAKYPDICRIEHSPLYTPADEWFECDGKRVHVTGYYYDGIILRLRYETCYDYPLNSDTPAVYGYALPNSLVDGVVSLCNGEYDESRISEGIIGETVNAFVKTPAETLDIPFGDGIFTVHKNNSVSIIEKDIDKVMTVSNDDTIHFDRFVLSSGNLSIAMSGSPYTNDYTSETGTAYIEALLDLNTVITLASGDTIQFNAGWNEPAGMGPGYKFYQFTDPIDINDVTSITIDGLEIYSVENTETAE